MATSRPTPVDRETRFGIDELFFSTTDEKGRIRDGNAVFERVSGHSRERMIGQPHNLVRHPDMPRGVFRLLWDRLLEGHAVAAYVKNMSADGSYYWVMAVAVPSDGGYLSVRLKPTSEHLAVVQALYAHVLEAERDLAEHLPPPEVAVEGKRVLLEAMADAGFADYWALESLCLPAEILARETAKLDRRGAADGSATWRSLDDTADGFSALFHQVHEYQRAGTALETASTTIRRLADSVRLNALNGLIAAQHLAGDGATLSIVADRMTQAAHDITGQVAALDTELGPTVELIRRLAFRISIAKLQTDMAQVFAREDPDGAALRELVGCLADSGEAAVVRAHDMEGHFSVISRQVDTVESALRALGALHICGRIEVAGVRDDAGFGVLLDDINRQIGEGLQQVEALRDAARRCTSDVGRIGDVRHRAAAVRADLPEPVPA